MPRLDHRQLERLFFTNDLAPVFQGVGGIIARRRHRNLKLALGVQMVYSTYNMLFAVYEMIAMDNPVHSRPPAELFKVMAYISSCFVAYRSVSAYLRLMFVWTLTTAFNGVYQPLLWLKNVSGSPMEQYLVWMLLVLSIAGMAGNISGAMTIFPWQPSTVRRERRGWGSEGSTKES